MGTAIIQIKIHQVYLGYFYYSNLNQPTALIGLLLIVITYEYKNPPSLLRVLLLLKLKSLKCTSWNTTLVIIKSKIDKVHYSNLNFLA